jgi:hypothetical protein
MGIVTSIAPSVVALQRYGVSSLQACARVTFPERIHIISSSINESQQAKLWDLTKIVTDIVSAIAFVRSRGTNHGQFKASLTNSKMAMVTLGATLKFTGVSNVKFCDAFYHC